MVWSCHIKNIYCYNSYLFLFICIETPVLPTLTIQITADSDSLSSSVNGGVPLTIYLEHLIVNETAISMEDGAPYIEYPDQSR